MDTTPKYHVTESTNPYGTTVYAVSRTDGTPAAKDSRIYGATYTSRENAEIHSAFVNATPEQYRIERGVHPQRSIRSGKSFWKISGCVSGDPQPLRHTWDDGTDVKGDWPEGTTMVDVLIHMTQRHADGADARIAKAAEAQAVAAAEETVRQARATQLAQARADKGELATPRQVDYILQLLQAREYSGEGGGFFVGPKDRAGIEELSKAQASAYIRSLKGDY